MNSRSIFITATIVALTGSAQKLRNFRIHNR